MDSWVNLNVLSHWKEISTSVLPGFIGARKSSCHVSVIWEKFTLLCVCACMCHGHMLVPGHVQSACRGQRLVLNAFLKLFLSLFLRLGLSQWTNSSQFWVSWLDSELWGAFCLHSLLIQPRRSCRCVLLDLVFTWVPVKTQVFLPAQKAICPLNHLPDWEGVF